jgi:hypothetical protein
MKNQVDDVEVAQMWLLKHFIQFHPIQSIHPLHRHSREPHPNENQPTNAIHHNPSTNLIQKPENYRVDALCATRTISGCRLLRCVTQ